MVGPVRPSCTGGFLAHNRISHYGVFGLPDYYYYVLYRSSRERIKGITFVHALEAVFQAFTAPVQGALFSLQIGIPDFCTIRIISANQTTYYYSAQVKMTVPRSIMKDWAI